MIKVAYFIAYELFLCQDQTVQYVEACFYFNWTLHKLMRRSPDIVPVL